MPEITTDTPRKEVTIAGGIFKLPMPYAEGHTITAGEAMALNQTYHENVRNIMAAKIKKAAEDAKTKGEAERPIEDWDGDIQTYLAEYEFGVRSARSGTSAPTDPVDREALALAKDIVRNALKANGFALKDVPAEKVDELARNLLEQRPEIRAQAEKTVEFKANSKMDLGALGNVEVQPAAVQESEQGVEAGE